MKQLFFRADGEISSIPLSFSEKDDQEQLDDTTKERA